MNQVVQHKAHPWHGIPIGDAAPNIVNAYIEIVPNDTVKYEIDKETGHLKVDRPQKYSNYCPTLYGFVPKTYCGKGVGAFCANNIGRAKITGDGDPLDICVLTEKPIQHGDILVRAVPIGGIRILDDDQADDKIIAVLYNDSVYGAFTDISQCPEGIINRLKHYFLTYKEIPGETNRKIELADIYDADEARRVVEISCEDYQNEILKSG
jgi:inorganic pyrophosphatase